LKPYDKPDDYLSYLTRPSAIFSARGSVRSKNSHFLLLPNLSHVRKSRFFACLFIPIGAQGGTKEQGVKQ